MSITDTDRGSQESVIGTLWALESSRSHLVSDMSMKDSVRLGRRWGQGCQGPRHHTLHRILQTQLRGRGRCRKRTQPHQAPQSHPASRSTQWPHTGLNSKVSVPDATSCSQQTRIKKQFKTGHAQVNRPVVAVGTVTTGDSGSLTPHGKGHSHGKFFTASLSRVTDVPEVAQHRPVK